MVKIVLSAAEASLISQSPEAIEVFDPAGKRLGVFVQAYSSDELETARQRRDSNKPRYTTSQVLDHLRSLDQQ